MNDKNLQKFLVSMATLPENEETKKWEEVIQKEDNAILKILIGKKNIKPAFLIKMKNKIDLNPRFQELVPNVYTFDYKSYRRVLGCSNYAWDLCRFIVAVHQDFTKCMSNSEKATLICDKEYSNRLQDEVIDLIALRPFGIHNLSSDSYEGLTPIIYMINAINNYLIEVLNYNLLNNGFKEIRNYKFRIQFLSKLTSKIRAAVVLMDNLLIEEVYPHLRSIVELLMVYLILLNANDEALLKYNNYFVHNSNYQLTRVMPEEVEKDFLENVGNNKQVSKYDYLRNGWLDSVFEYSYIDKRKRTYKAKDLCEVIDMMYYKTNPNLGSRLYDVYRECNPLSHGFNVMIDNYQTELTLARDLGHVVVFLMNEFDKLMEVDFNINGINLYDKFTQEQKKVDKRLNFLLNDKEIKDKIEKKYVREIK